MNKKELIEHYEDLSKKLHIFPVVAIIRVLEDLQQLDEPQKVTIPQFVASWIKYCKGTGVDLYHALEMGDLYFCNYANQKDDLKLKDFFEVEGNQEIFARAWLDGYTVKKEPRYIVKMKNIHSYSSTLKRDDITKEYFFGNEVQMCASSSTHTRKELEQAGFSWVFDSPGIEIEEVEGWKKLKY
jgi:hypothetical protein|nr:MAG TPA: Protein of unknown function (DUF1642) [Caudoviricetes sp.]